MLFKDIEAVFTAKVQEYLLKGYTFNCNTMAGSQGEIAKVDLRKGNEIIRILMYEDYRFCKNDVLRVVVGRNPEKVGKSKFETVWNNKLEIIEETEYIKVTSAFYVETEEEIKAIEAKRHDRYMRKRNMPVVLGEGSHKIVLPFVKRQKGFKSCKLKDISHVEKLTMLRRSKYRVVIHGGKTIELK